MRDFTDLIDLASERLGGAVLAANDEWFAPKDGLVKPGKPEWREGEYTERGKWMDGWETRRRREPGEDWAIVRLGAPGVVKGVVIDTAFFTGNYPESASVEACAVEGTPAASVFTDGTVQWTTLLPRTPLAGDTANSFEIPGAPRRVTHLRLTIHPDGGVARLRAFGLVQPSAELLAAGELHDLAAMEHGGYVVECSDMWYGHRQNLILPGRSTHMGDGWETRRRRGEGNDWSIVRLAARGSIERVELDTDHFKGNAPGACMIECCDAGDSAPDAPFDAASQSWRPLLARTPLQPHSRHRFTRELQRQACTHVRLNIYPDGGVARLRVFGRTGATMNAEAVARAGIARLNAMPRAELAEHLRECCGSSRWVERMIARRPWPLPDALLQASDDVCRTLSTDDWMEAFTHHPRLGESRARVAQGERASQWSAREQAGLSDAGAELRAALAAANAAYEETFGYICIICATGLDSEELLAITRARLGNTPAIELRIAAEEQRKITRLRLRKLFTDAPAPEPT